MRQVGHAEEYVLCQALSPWKSGIEIKWMRDWSEAVFYTLLREIFRIFPKRKHVGFERI